jgi:hypothetical protein
MGIASITWAVGKGNSKRVVILKVGHENGKEQLFIDKQAWCANQQSCGEGVGGLLIPSVSIYLTICLLIALNGGLVA